MSGNGAVESMSQQGGFPGYTSKLLRTIGVHDMKTFDSFYTIPRSQPRERYQRLIG